MRLEDLGEFALISRIERLAARCQDGRGVRLGIGDDAAVIRLPRGADLVVSTDAFVEGTHFRWENQSPRVAGRRAMVANLSDLAAMGARPLYFTLSLELPPDLELSRLDGLMRGILFEAERAGCPLVGGNITRSSHTSISIGIGGTVPAGRELRRDGARIGDRIFVTGVVGAQALAWRRAEILGTRLRRVPEARLAAGTALGHLRGVGACIDISDGLLADLRHVLEASGVGARLAASQLPLPGRFSAACSRLGHDPQGMAMGGGEDYELLFTLRKGVKLGAVQLTRKLGVKTTEIGEIVAFIDDQLPEIGGWAHF